MNLSDMKEIDEEIGNLMSSKSKIVPYREALYITIWYVILGSLWILFSDTLVNMLVKNPEAVKLIQLIKGWLYVVLTGVYIYLLIYFRIKLLKKVADEVYDSSLRLAEANEELMEKESMIYELSYYDRMTGLLNWVGLSNAFDSIVDENKTYAMYYIDIDNIKHINDTLGHDQGNVLLNIIAEKLQKIKSTNDLLARLSGDEFILFSECEGDDELLNKRASKLVSALRTNWKIDRYEFLISASVGIARYPEDGINVEQLIMNSDAAMFIAKDQGKDRHYIYHKNISKQTENYVEMISQIRHGINKEEFELYYQPIVKLGTGELLSVEALIRWRHPLRGFLTPYHFIKIAEDSGQINEIGKWVFDKACRQIKEWDRKGFSPTKISVNLSGKRLFAPDLLYEIKNSLKESNVAPSRIQIEITETAVMENLKGAISILNEIRSLGITFALDDFGTGYSSLTYLQMFPIDVLKIDKEFISNISVEGMEKENNIIDAVIKLGHSLNLKIVAEGIETNEQAEFLMINDCDYGQGYFYNKPLSVDELEEKYFKAAK